jgi:prevent-host-death family protein
VTKVWQLQEAKNKFSQVVNEALNKGPQVVTRRGKEIVVILSREDYGRLKKSQSGVVEFFQSSPLVGVELDLERDKTHPREVTL